MWTVRKLSAATCSHRSHTGRASHRSDGIWYGSSRWKGMCMSCHREDILYDSLQKKRKKEELRYLYRCKRHLIFSNIMNLNALTLLNENKTKLSWIKTLLILLFSIWFIKQYCFFCVSIFSFFNTLLCFNALYSLPRKFSSFLFVHFAVSPFFSFFLYLTKL